MAKLHELQADLARHDVGEAEHPHPRNCVLNLVVTIDDRHGADACDRAIAGVAASHPLRAILVHRDGGAGPGTLDAEIVSEAHRVFSGFPVQREQVLLHVRGHAAQHLASLVEPLLVPDVPTYLWWSGRERLDEKTLRGVMTFCDVLVVDSGRLAFTAEALLELARLAGDPLAGIGLADFRWARLKPWRDTVGQFFAPRDRWALLGGLHEVTAEAAGPGPEARVGAALLAGWAASALGWRVVDARASGDSTEAVAEVAAGHRVRITLRSVASERHHHGELLSLRLSGRAGGRMVALAMERDPSGDRHAHVTIGLDGGEPVRQRLNLPRLDDPDLLVYVLLARRPDPVFQSALLGAASLLETLR